MIKLVTNHRFAKTYKNTLFHSLQCQSFARLATGGHLAKVSIAAETFTGPPTTWRTSSLRTKSKSASMARPFHAQWPRKAWNAPQTSWVRERYLFQFSWQHDWNSPCAITAHHLVFRESDTSLVQHRYLSKNWLSLCSLWEPCGLVVRNSNKNPLGYLLAQAVDHLICNF